MSSSSSASSSSSSRSPFVGTSSSDVVASTCDNRGRQQQEQEQIVERASLSSPPQPHRSHSGPDTTPLATHSHQQPPHDTESEILGTDSFLEEQKPRALVLNKKEHEEDEDDMIKRRKEFGDCALIEIIHLHECLRGALKALENDVMELQYCLLGRQQHHNRVNGSGDKNSSNDNNSLADLERRVAGRFKVIWSVFRAHSKAEDEFIWPCLRAKTQGRVGGAASEQQAQRSPESQPKQQEQTCGEPSYSESVSCCKTSSTKACSAGCCLEQSEYEEDHADEERMFREMDALLAQLREGLVKQQPLAATPTSSPSNASLTVTTTTTTTTSPCTNANDNPDLENIVTAVSELTRALCKHLIHHLEKEETQCMPLVLKHLSKSEIHELVGKIMGKRSADTIAQIMTMAVQNLDTEDREEMVRYMKQSMAGTFFESWLLMSGWMSSTNSDTDTETTTPEDSWAIDENDKKRASAIATTTGADDFGAKRAKKEPSAAATLGDSNATTQQQQQCIVIPATTIAQPRAQITSQAELEKLIRAIMSNPALTPVQKNTTIQGLRDSVWKSNQRHRSMPPTPVNAGVTVHPGLFMPQTSTSAAAAGATWSLSSSSLTTATLPPQLSAASGAALTANSRTRRVTPPSMYYIKNPEGKVKLVWSSDAPGCGGESASRQEAAEVAVPLFSAAELAPTYHDGATGSVLGCPHYARACKLRHPKSGRLYTCRLCCQQQRELPLQDQDEPLDRFSVKEVMCMKCNALQPAEDRCLNRDCESRGKPYAKYFCRICHFYDDGARSIFHCPYCNICRLGKGLGIDYRHCMKCNACVSLETKDHRCIPQKLQGDCPICHESMFQSTEPLKGLRCGHVMHLACFTEYRRGHSYTCPLCMRSMEDMKDYFGLLDTAIRMQPMPRAYLSTVSNIYCQDCDQTGQTPYHFVGQKCPHCGSYNTRELGREHRSPTSSP